MTNIGSYAFRTCAGVTSITIPDSVTLDKSTLTMNVGDTYQLTANVLPSDATNPYQLSWLNFSGNLTASGCAAILTFEIAEDAAAGDYPIKVDYFKGPDGGYIDGVDVNFDENIMPLELTYADGRITVSDEIKISESDGSITATAPKDGTLIIAQYGDAGELVAVSSAAVSVGDSLTAEKVETAKRFAAYLWDSFSAMQPVK